MIALGSDHGGLALKRHVMEYLDARGLEYQDFGCYTAESCDYPDFGRAAAEAVASGACDRGIVICTTGIGISISANKVKGIRCALCSEPLSAEMTRRHNDANMLAMGGGLGAVPGLRAADLLPGLLVVLVVSGGMCGTLCWVHQRILRMGISEA